MLAPLELIRTNFQAFNPLSHKRDLTVKSFVKQTGVKGLWLGVSATLARDVPFSAIYWTCYEFFKGHLKHQFPSTKTGNFLASFAGGCASGMISALVTTPIDLIKTRLQTSAGKAITAREIAWSIYANEGPSGFMRGWLPRAAKVGPACAIMISSYELIKSFGSEPEFWECTS